MGQSSSASTSADMDSDQTAAWEELNEYLNQGGISSSGSSGPRSRAGTGGPRRRSDRSAGRGGPPVSLRKDFANLELPFGASLEQARAAHRKLIRAYHPDRHASNPDKYRIANEITQRINYSFQRIKQYYEHGITPEGSDSV